MKYSKGSQYEDLRTGFILTIESFKEDGRLWVSQRRKNGKVKSYKLYFKSTFTKLMKKEL
jgi:hypothetical protein